MTTSVYFNGVLLYVLLFTIKTLLHNFKFFGIVRSNMISVAHTERILAFEFSTFVYAKEPKYYVIHNVPLLLFRF